MNRSGYDEWRRKLNDTIVSPEGQAFLRELAYALDALPDKCLIEGELIDEEGDCCAIGAVCMARGIDTEKINDAGARCVAERLGVPRSLVAEIVDRNDSCRETPERRWQRMRKWVDRHITKDGGE